MKKDSKRASDKQSHEVKEFEPEDIPLKPPIQPESLKSKGKTALNEDNSVDNELKSDLYFDETDIEDIDETLDEMEGRDVGYNT